MDLPYSSEAPSARLRSALLAAGLRVTRQRAAVYDQLLQLDHPSAEEVYQQVRATAPVVSLATVYTALDVLVASGLVSRIMADQGSSRYDARRDHHYHLRCLRTGALVDLDTRFDPNLLTKLDPLLPSDLSRQGFQVTGYRLEVLGYFDDPSLPDPRQS